MLGLFAGTLSAPASAASHLADAVEPSAMWNTALGFHNALRQIRTSHPNLNNLQLLSFESCAAKWRQLELPLPPVGAGWFEVLYMDEELRLCKDSRGDLQVCTRR